MAAHRCRRPPRVGGARRAPCVCRCFAVLHGSSLTQITRARVDAFVQRSAQLAGSALAEIIAEDFSDALAPGAYRAIKERRLSTPDDAAGMGVGDHDLTPFFAPSLFCVGISHRDPAEHASTLLLQQFARGAESGRTLSVPLVEALRASMGLGE